MPILVWAYSRLPPEFDVSVIMKTLKRISNHHECILHLSCSSASVTDWPILQSLNVFFQRMTTFEQLFPKPDQFSSFSFKFKLFLTEEQLRKKVYSCSSRRLRRKNTLLKRHEIKSEPLAANTVNKTAKSAFWIPIQTLFPSILVKYGQIRSSYFSFFLAQAVRSTVGVYSCWLCTIHPLFLYLIAPFWLEKASAVLFFSHVQFRGHQQSKLTHTHAWPHTRLLK